MWTYKFEQDVWTWVGGMKNPYVEGPVEIPRKGINFGGNFVKI